MTRPHLLIILALAMLSVCRAELPKVTEVKQFTGIYPASAALQIPFHGCVELDRPLPANKCEYWLSANHLIRDDDFGEIYILVNSERTVLGGRAVFRGSVEEWQGVRGYSSRKRVLHVFLGGDGPDLSKDLPLAYDGSDFGGMVFTFDRSGNVTWRKSPEMSVSSEADYKALMKRHERNDEASVVLPRPRRQPHSAEEGCPQ